MTEIKPIIISFLAQLPLGLVEIYVEFSLEHELGIYLRANLPTSYKVQFERPVDFFDLKRPKFVKKEIDISIFGPGKFPRHTIELKYPRAGQYPEQMFKSCQDISFIEQLVRSGFSKSYFLMLVEDPLFYRGSSKHGIYAFFREGKPINGIIQKPTGSKDEEIYIGGSYEIQWMGSMSGLKYALVEI